MHVFGDVRERRWFNRRDGDKQENSEEIFLGELAVEHSRCATSIATLLQSPSDRLDSNFHIKLQSTTGIQAK